VVTTTTTHLMAFIQDDPGQLVSEKHTHALSLWLLYNICN